MYILDELQNDAARLGLKRRKRDHVQPFQSNSFIGCRFGPESSTNFSLSASTPLLVFHLSILLSFSQCIFRLGNSFLLQTVVLSAILPQKQLGKEHFLILAQHSRMLFRMISATLSVSSFKTQLKIHLFKSAYNRLLFAVPATNVFPACHILICTVLPDRSSVCVFFFSFGA